jgi:cation diffusion facilitator family transporter
MSDLGGYDTVIVHDRHDEGEHRQAANRAVAVSAVGLAVTGTVELALAVLTGSVALLGDALHNLSDVSTSAVVFIGFRVSKRPPTSRYPYGYERAEDLAGLGVALVVWLSAVFAGVESYRKLIDHGHTSNVYLGMAGAVFGIIGNQVVARYKLRVGRRINSATLVADATHSRLDALSSVGALVGLILVASGARWGDPVAGLAVTLFIVNVGREVTGEMLHHLMDGVDPSHLKMAATAASSVPGVMTVDARGRWMGRSLVIDIDAQVAAGLSMTAAEAIGGEVRTAIFEVLDEARRVNWSAHPAREMVVGTG